jgi:hypothetical protein
VELKRQVLTAVLRNSSKPLLLKILWIFNSAFHNNILLKLPLLTQSRRTLWASFKKNSIQDR